MDLATVLKSSKFISASVHNVSGKLELVTMLYNNIPAYMFPLTRLGLNVVKTEDIEYINQPDYENSINRIENLKNAKYEAIYEIINSQENQDTVSFIQKLNSYEDIVLNHKILLNVMLDLPTLSSTPGFKNFFYYEKDISISGKFIINSWDFYPKITNIALHNPNTLKFMINGIIENIEIKD